MARELLNDRIKGGILVALAVFSIWNIGFNPSRAKYPSLLDVTLQASLLTATQFSKEYEKKTGHTLMQELDAFNKQNSKKLSEPQETQS